MKAGFLQPLLAKGGSHRLENLRSGVVVVETLTAAVDSSSRRKGLLGHTSMPAGSGLVIAPSNAVHTFFMKFPIDVVFLSKTGHVLKIRPAVPAWRMAASLLAFAVLEMPAGSIERSDLKVGDQVVLRAAAQEDSRA
jgi:uncharacterized membrane protein (UPF0127 family)